MGNFQSCVAAARDRDEPRLPPPYPYPQTAAAGGRSPSDDEPRDSSLGRAIMDPTLRKGNGAGGQAVVRMVHRTGSSCDVYLLGATVTS
jgi:hypothetical protein